MNPAIGDTSGIDALTHRFRTITENLANTGKVGFKRRLAVFEGAGGPGSGSSVDSRTAVDFSQGPMVHTGRRLDLAIHGRGFFAIEDPDAPGGAVYTRNGVFRVNDKRQLVDGAGRLVAGQTGVITIPPTVPEGAISVGRDGSLSFGDQPIGRLRIVAFEDPAMLMPTGTSDFTAPPGVDPLEVEAASVQQGFQETSNVVSTQELVDLIMVTRLYEANVKTMNVQDERMKNLIQTVS